MKRLAESGDWAALEEKWIDCLSQEEIDVDLLLEIAGTGAQRDRKRSVLLLGVLAEELAAREQDDELERVVRAGLQWAPNNELFASMVLQLVKRKYGDPASLESVLNFSNLSANTDVLAGWKSLEALMALREGNYVQHHAWGAGKVAEMDYLSEEVVIDFSSRVGHRMKWSMAVRSLEPLDRDHILAYSVDRANALSAMQPVELLTLALRSLGGEGDAKEIRRLVEPVIGRGSWPSWWNKARSQTKQGSSIRTTLDRPVKFRWIGSAGIQVDEDPVEELRRLPFKSLLVVSPRVAKETGRSEDVRKLIKAKLMVSAKTDELKMESFLVLEILGDPTARPSIEGFLSSCEDPVGVIRSIRLLESRKRALDVLEALRPEQVQATRYEFFVATNDPKDWQMVTERMSEEEKVDLVWTIRRHLPEAAHAYFWLMRQGDEDYPIPYPKLERVTTLLDLVTQVRSLVNPIAAYFSDREVLVEALRDAGKERAAELRRLVRDTHQLPVTLREEMARVTGELYPELEDMGGFVLVSESGYKRRGDELRMLVKEELPQNKKAIAEAMAHGDLRENFEYKAAKEQQERILARIGEIEEELSRARLLRPGDVDTTVVNPGCKVTMVGKEGLTRIATILGPWDSAPDRDIYSYQAPAVQQLLGKSVGERVSGALWHDTEELEIVSIEPWK
jgi:transcription elongation GreA/GreB family factor